MTTNYAAHIIDQMAGKGPNPAYPTHGATWKMLRALIPDAIKFRLPDKGYILGMARDSQMTVGEQLSKFAPGQRLPYDVMAVEYAVPPEGRNGDFDDAIEGAGNPMNYDATFMLLTQTDSTVFGVPMFRFQDDCHQRHWGISNFGFQLDIDAGLYTPMPITEIGRDLMRTHPGAAINDIIGEASTVVDMLCALACSNTEIRDTDPPKEKQNQKRVKKGKTPFYTYKVLTVMPGKASQKGVPGGGSHSSPRVHLRRGHIRRLPGRTVWVNAAVVGDKSRGMVSKDYSITAA